LIATKAQKPLRCLGRYTRFGFGVFWNR